MKAPTLATLAKLAEIATNDPDALPDLVSYLTTHAETFAPLFGVSTAQLCADANDPRRSWRLAIRDAQKRERETSRNVKDRDATIAADRVTEGARFTDQIGIVELDAKELRRALACGEDRLRLVFLDGSHVDVNADCLRRIIAERKDARVYVDTARIVVSVTPPVTVRWGAKGGMRLRALPPLTASDTHGALSRRVTLRTVHVPGVAFALGGVELDVAAE